MLPAAFARLVGLTAEKLAELAGEIAPLAKALKAAEKAVEASGVFFKFGAIVRGADPTLSWRDVSDRLKAVRYFADQGKYLTGWDKDTRIDRRVAALLPTDTGLGPKGELFRYHVNVEITFSGTGDTKDFGVWVGSDEYLTPGEAMDLAVAQLFGKWKPGSKPVEYGGENATQWVFPTLTGFTRFTMKGV